MKEARELLKKIKSAYEGHRHDELLSVRVLHEILRLMEMVMDQTEATAQATSDTNTLLGELGKGLGDLLDEVKKLQALLPDPAKAEEAVKATEALDQRIKEATAEVQAADATTAKTEAEAPSAGDQTTS